jgi:putrescine aminotransferase
VGTRARDLSVKNGLVMRAVWDTLIVAPPLVIEPRQIDELVSKAVQTLDELHHALRAEGAL